jgi:hypothetical protein
MSRRRFGNHPAKAKETDIMRSALVYLFLVMTFTQRIVGAEPIFIAEKKQLFIDSKFIAKSRNIKLRTNPAQKLGRITDNDGQPLQGHVNKVLDFDGRTRLYLGADHAEVIDSDDGIRFQRTGIRFPGEFPTIMFDEHDSDPSRRYKLFWGQFSAPFNAETDGIYAAYSADGVHFIEPRVVPALLDR